MSPVEPSKPFSGQGNVVFDGLIYSGNPCVVNVTTQEPPRGPKNERWLEGTVACGQLKAPDGKVMAANGRFAGRFEDHVK
jgi:hypothetical protein